METKIINQLGSWEDVVDACRFTVGKAPLGHNPSKEFRKSILISEHTPIRLMTFRWTWTGMKHWVTTHFARHRHEKFIRTQRPDRTGAERGDQNAPQDYMGDANIQQLIDLSRKRLCAMSADETHMACEALKLEIHKTEPEISDVMVPNCVYRCGCPEPDGCGWFRWACDNIPGIRSTDIQSRYDAYNKYFRGDEDDSQ